LVHRLEFRGWGFGGLRADLEMVEMGEIEFGGSCDWEICRT
jgi:hypothetical protein